MVLVDVCFGFLRTVRSEEVDVILDRRQSLYKKCNKSNSLPFISQHSL